MNNYYYGEVHVSTNEYSGNFSESNNQFGDDSQQNIRNPKLNRAKH